MRRTFLTALVLATASAAFAQTAREEIHAKKERSGSNYLAYETPTKKLTPAPKGYEPFYINHYGRHGSRWLIGENDYKRPLATLREAHEAGELTALGEDVLQRFERFYPTTINRLGDLTTVGERQHHGIGKRMTERFPEVFRGKAEVDARSTVVIRCILSMEAECEEITAFNPDIKIHNDVSEAFQYYLNQEDSKYMHDIRWVGDDVKAAYRDKFTQPERFCGLLFKKGVQYFEKESHAKTFMRRMFEVCSNMQSHDTDISFYDLFTEDELYDLWKTKNIEWYINYAASPLSKTIVPFCQYNLLKNMLDTADTILVSGRHGATLRFGHEVCVLPLACLLELDSCGRQVENLDELDQQWVNYRIFPMGCNIQLVYYRPKKGKSGDVLVKALLNEKEATLPVHTDRYPYYRWKDVEAYLRNKLASYREED